MTGTTVLASSTTGYNNTATGFDALVGNGSSSGNTANGTDALGGNGTGSDNTPIGLLRLIATARTTTTSLWPLAGANLTAGSSNIDIGDAGIADEAEIIRIGTPGTQWRHTLPVLATCHLRAAEP